jgi:hypothetical protein
VTTTEMIAFIALILIAVGLPVGGLVIRFALRPLVHDIAAAIRGQQDPGLVDVMQRLEQIDARLAGQEERTVELLETHRFHRELEAGRASEGLTPDE